MKSKILMCTLFYLSFLNLNAQNTDEIKQNLIGRWRNINLVDSNNKKVNISNTRFTDLVFEKNEKLITSPDNKPQYSNWSWISDTEVELSEIIPIDSERAKFAYTSRFKGVKELDGKGNYILRDTLRIEWIKKTKIKIYSGGRYYRIYKKV